MHKAGKSEKGFGFDVVNSSTPQINTWTSDSGEFYGKYRLGYQLKLALDQCSNSTIYRKGQNLIKNPAPFFENIATEPCLLHCDLWSGNISSDKSDKPVILDAACYYGHNEAEFRISCEEFVSCFPIIVRLSHYEQLYNCSVGDIVVDGSRRRNYSSQVLLDPVSERHPANTEIYNPANTEVRNSANTHMYKYPYTRDSSSDYKHVFQSSCLQHRFKKWQDQRKLKLTASTFSGAIGFWCHRRVQLWLEKIGAIEPFSGNMATCWSNVKEEEAVERYKLITGNTVLFPTFQVYGKNNIEDNWLAASPDGVVDKYYGLDSGGVLEIRCPFFNGDMSKAAPWRRIAFYCIPQAQGLMEILDKDWMDFYVWTPNGSSLFRLHRDVEYWDALKIALSDFWLNHVQPAKELCSKYRITDPLNELRYLKPAPRHELCSYIVYESKRIVDSSQLLMREINGQLRD